MNIEGIDIDKIMKLYIDGKDIVYIADYYKIDNKSVLLQKTHQYITQNSLFDVYTKRIHNINPKELYDLRENKLKNAEIADLYDISPKQVSSIIQKYCKKNNLKSPYYNSKKIDLDEEGIEQDMLKGMTYAEMTEKYGVSATTLKKRLLKKYTEQEIFNIKHKKFFGNFKDIDNLAKIYETGIRIKDISNCCNISVFMIERLLLEHYKAGFKSLPKVVSETTFLTSIYNNKESIESLQKKAKIANRIIPSYLINKYNGFVLDVNNIRKYIEEKVLTNKDDEKFKQSIIDDIDFSILLKNKNYDIKHQITALLYHLPNTDYSNISELINVVGR